MDALVYILPKAKVSAGMYFCNSGVLSVLNDPVADYADAVNLRRIPGLYLF